MSIFGKRVLITLFVGIVTSVSGLTVKKGPYLIFEGNNTSMTIMWQVESNTTCYVRWGTTSDCGLGSGTCTEYTEYPEGVLYSFKIAGLTPGEKYFYQVDDDVNNDAGDMDTIGSGSFRTAPDNTAKNVVLWGYGDSQAEEDKATQIQKNIRGVYSGVWGSPEPEKQTICLRLGDWTDAQFTAASNIRNIGLEKEKNWTDYHFTSSHEQFLREMPMAGPLGNHESSGYLHRRYYPFPYETKYENKKELNEDERKLNWGFTYGPVRISVLDVTYENVPAPDLTTEVNNAKNKWWIVLTHAPAYGANGGHENNTNLQNAIKKLDRKPNLVISGHNHYYSHCEVDGVHHVTSAGGGSGLRIPDVEKYLKPQSNDENAIASQIFHFFSIDITSNTLVFSVYNYNFDPKKPIAPIKELSFLIEYNVVWAEPVPTQFDRCVSNRFSSPQQAMQKTMPPSITSYSAGDTTGGRKVLNLETGSNTR